MLLLFFRRPARLGTGGGSMFPGLPFGRARLDVTTWRLRRLSMPTGRWLGAMPDVVDVVPVVEVTPTLLPDAAIYPGPVPDTRKPDAFAESGTSASGSSFAHRLARLLRETDRRRSPIPFAWISASRRVCLSNASLRSTTSTLFFAFCAFSQRAFSLSSKAIKGPRDRWSQCRTGHGTLPFWSLVGGY